MRLALHIFKKDARRLWWEIAISFGVLAMLAHQDSTRADAVPGPLEGLLNLLLPLVWIYLIALLTHQDSLVGDRQFWRTRPVPRTALLGAKALFLLAFIHAPSFLADAIVVGARGFQPLNHAPALLWKQLVLTGAMTLPAMALAAVTRNLVQFFPITVLLAAGAAALGGNLGLVQPWIRIDEVRLGLVLLTIGAGAIGIITVQYSAMRTRTSRILGIAVLVSTALLYIYVPREFTATVGCTLSGRRGDAAGVAVRFAPERGQLPEAWNPEWPGRDAQFALPVDVAGVSADLNRAILHQLRFGVSVPGKEHWAMSSLPPPGSPPADPVSGVIWPADRKSWWQMVRAQRAVYDRIVDAPVTLTGKVAAHIVRQAEPITMDISPHAKQLSGIGRCSSIVTLDRTGREMLKVLCESPSKLPLSTRVSLIHPDYPDLRPRGLGDSGNFFSYPAWAWLSPIDRRQTFFHLTEESRARQDSTWLVPPIALAGAKLELAPLQLERCMVFTYELADISLGEFVTRRPRP